MFISLYVDSLCIEADKRRFITLMHESGRGLVGLHLNISILPSLLSAKTDAYVRPCICHYIPYIYESLKLKA